jgi:hypothetical protein
MATNQLLHVNYKTAFVAALWNWKQVKQLMIERGYGHCFVEDLVSKKNYNVQIRNGRLAKAEA